MNKVDKDRHLLIEADRRLQETAQQLLMAKKEKERLLKEIEIKNDALADALKKLQQQSSQMAQAEKMNALGIMTAGIAHELNNPMMGILNFIQYSIKHTTDQKKVNEVLVNAERETLRCGKIVESLLLFSRSEKFDMSTCRWESCAKLFELVLMLLNYRIKREGIKLTKHFDSQTPEVPIMSNGVQQVFLNLMTNALDAVSESKRKEIDISIYSNKNYVQVDVKDSGSGIKAEVLQKIFEPFYTTKVVGKGTGLGLSVSKSIIERHNGKISCHSKLNHGTIFSVLLPTTCEHECQKGEISNES